MKQALGAKTYLFPTPVLLVGTYDQEGKPNLMTAAWGGICCSKPVCINVSLRKATHSYQGILDRQAFTVGVPGASQVAEADYCGMATGRKVDKFASLGFSPVKSQLVDAPYAEEVPFILECRLLQHVELGLHTLFVGEVLDIKADQAILGPDGQPDMARLQPFCYDPAARGYHRIGERIGDGFSIGKTIGQ
jgi:flavin reductase (DIM6/NTAB) family NADH-FMN oxidoreductase RutF